MGTAQELQTLRYEQPREHLPPGQHHRQQVNPLEILPSERARAAGLRPLEKTIDRPNSIKKYSIKTY